MLPPSTFVPSRSCLRALVAVGFLAGCGGAPPGPAAPPPPPPDLKPVAKEPPVDVAPVPEPANLVLLARVNKPEAIVKTVGTWTRLPLPAGKELVRQVNEAAADVVDLGQPLDVAMTVSLSRHGPEALYAFSVGMKSFDEAKARFSQQYKTLPAANGGLKIQGLLDRGGHRAEVQDDPDDDDRDLCVLAHAANGANGAKLVCGPADAVEALTPYLSRTMPRESWTADVHLEARPEPVRAPLGEMRGMIPLLARQFGAGKSAAMRELVESSIGEVFDMVEDAQKLTVDAKIDDAGINATSRFEFQGTKSLFARAMTDASRADVAPAAFWHLPGDTDTAFFMRGSDAKLYDHPREMLTNLLVEGMEMAQLPEAEKKAVHDLVGDKMLRLFANGGTGIYAKGFDQAALEKAVKAREAVKEGDWLGKKQANRAVGEQVIGWHLYQVSDPIAKVGPILKDWSMLWGRPAFTKWMEQKTGTKTKEMPKLRITPVPAGVTLPKDAVHLEVTIPVDDAVPPMAIPPPPPPARPGEKTPPKPQTPAQPKPVPQKPMLVHIYAVPDGATTWLAFGVDGKLVGTKIAQALASAPDAGTLGKTATGVELLKESKINGGGMVTMRGLLVFTAFDAGDRNSFLGLAGLPGKGALPVVFTGHAEAPAGSARAGTSVGRLVVSRQVIEDVVKFAMSQQ